MSFKYWKSKLGDEKGLTLLELVVVAAILAILAALAAAGVTGTATESRGTSKTNDINEVQKSVFNYIGQHPRSFAPTNDGCLPGQTTLGSGIDRTCPAGADPGAIDEDNAATFRAIIWDKAFATNDSPPVTKSFVPNFVQRAPKHAYEHDDGTPWPTVLATDPDGYVTAGYRVPDPLKKPVWALDSKGNVFVFIPDSAY